MREISSFIGFFIDYSPRNSLLHIKLNKQSFSTKSFIGFLVSIIKQHIKNKLKLARLVNFMCFAPISNVFSIYKSTKSTYVSTLN